MATTEADVFNRLADDAAAAAPKPPTQPVEQPKEPPVAEPAKEQPAQPGVPAEKPSEGAPPVEPEEEQELDLDEPAEASGSFETFKPVYESHPELKSKLKQIIGREAAYSELGTFSEVKQIVERVPTLEDAETITAQAQSQRALSEAFRNDPAAFAETLRENDPLAFNQFAQQLPEVLRRDAPDVWRNYATTFTAEVLSNAYEIAQNSRDEALANAVRMVHQALGLSAARPAREQVSPELEKLRKEKAEREKQDVDSQFDTFWQSTDGAITEGAVAVIDEQLKRILPNATQNQLERMRKEVWENTLSVLTAQPQTVAQLETFRKNAQKGRMGNAEYRQIVSYGVARAKLVIPKTVRAVVSEWTKEVLRINGESTEKKKAIATNTRDAGAGPQGTSSVTQQPAGSGKRRTSDDIFRELENRTYVPPSQRT